MAKKKTSKQPASTQSQTTQAAQVMPAVTVDADLKINKEDIVAIAVANHERSLLVEKTKLDQEIKNLEKQHSQTEKLLAERQEQHIEQLMAPEVEAIKKALSNFEKPEVRITSTILQDRIQFTLSIFGHHHGSGLSRNGEVLIPSELQVLSQEIADLSSQLAACREKAVSIRRALTSLDTVERQARAAVANSVLKQNPKGKEILDALSNPELQSLLGLDFLKPAAIEG